MLNRNQDLDAHRRQREAEDRKNTRPSFDLTPAKAEWNQHDANAEGWRDKVARDNALVRRAVENTPW